MTTTTEPAHAPDRVVLRTLAGWAIAAERASHAFAGLDPAWLASAGELRIPIASSLEIVHALSHPERAHVAVALLAAAFDPMITSYERVRASTAAHELGFTWRPEELVGLLRTVDLSIARHRTAGVA